MTLSGVSLFVAILATTAAATVAHELTHAAVAVVTGRFVGFDVLSVDVLYRAPERPDSVAYAIAGAPLVVGLCILLASLLGAFSMPVWAWPAWILYTLWGALTNDFKFRAAYDPDDVIS